MSTWWLTFLVRAGKLCGVHHTIRRQLIFSVSLSTFSYFIGHRPEHIFYLQLQWPWQFLHQSAGGVVTTITVIVCIFWVGIGEGIGFHPSGAAVNLIRLSLGLCRYCHSGHTVSPNIYSSMKDCLQFTYVLMFWSNEEHVFVNNLKVLARFNKEAWKMVSNMWLYIWDMGAMLLEIRLDSLLRHLGAAGACPDRWLSLSSPVLQNEEVSSTIAEIREKTIKFSMETEFCEFSPELEDHFEIFEHIRGFNVTVVTSADTKDETSLLWSNFMLNDEGETK